MPRALPWERLIQPSSVLGLGGVCRRCSRNPSKCVSQPENPPVPVHVHNHGVLPPAGQAVHHVPDSAAYTRRPLAVSTGRQVSVE